jgi:hypothetical protein
MATITLKINERTKAGKIFLAFVEQFVLNHKAVEVIKKPNEETLAAMHDAENGKTEKLSLTEFRKQLYE